MEDTGMLIAATAKISGTKALAALGGGLAIASVIVMAMTKPATHKEMVVALTCTFASSIFGGSAVVAYFHLQPWTHGPFGLMGIMGIACACGLPGWVTVRSVFIFLEKNRDKGIDWYINTVKEWLGKK